MVTSTSELSLCARINQRLEQSVGNRRYRMWFDRSAKLDYDTHEHRLRVAVPNRFVAEWITRNFQDELRAAAAAELGMPVDLDMRVEPDRFAATAGRSAPPPPPPSQAQAPGAAAAALDMPRPRRQSDTRTAPTLRHRLDDFIVGPSNELAFASAARLVDDETGHCNPLFIHGGCGLGKTHLLQGICLRMLDRKPEARVLYCTAEHFTNEFLDAVRGNKIEQFRKRIRRLDLLAVDDVHFLANKTATQQEFLHSFDAIDLGGARVALASDCHPKLIQQFSQALVSRCVSGMVVEVRSPDTATRVRIIQALAARRGLCLMDTVVGVLANHCRGSVREIEGTLTKLHALNHLAQTPYAPKSAAASAPAPGRGPGAAPAPDATIGHALLNRLLGAEHQHTGPRKAVHFDHIVSTVATHLGVTRAQLMSASRHRHLVLSRSLVIHLARKLTAMSFPEIATAMGRPSHSTIITAAQRLQRQLEANETLSMPGTLEQVALSELVERVRYEVGG